MRRWARLGRQAVHPVTSPTQVLGRIADSIAPSDAPGTVHYRWAVSVRAVYFGKLTLYPDMRPTWQAVSPWHPELAE